MKRHLASLLCAVLALAGCTSSTNARSGPSTTTTTTTTTTTSSSSPAVSLSIRPECLDVADKAKDLLTAAGRLATGNATVAKVRAAAGELSTSFEAAKQAIGPDASAHLDDAQQALRRVREALSSDPVDTGALRTASGDVVAALGEAATVCAPGSSTTSTVPSTEDTVTTTS